MHIHKFADLAVFDEVGVGGTLPATWIGCIGCPLASIKNWVREFRRYPGYRQMDLSEFIDMAA